MKRTNPLILHEMKMSRKLLNMGKSFLPLTGMIVKEDSRPRQEENCDAANSIDTCFTTAPIMAKV